MISRTFVSAAASALAAGLLVAAHVSSADAPEDPCAGKNPAYCKKDKAPAPAKPAAVDCEGRNPLYCKDQDQAAAPAKPADDDSGKGRAASDSRNPSRNPNQNPNQDPNRRPAHDSGE